MGARFEVEGPSLLRSLLLHIHKRVSDLSSISRQSDSVCKNIADEKCVHVVRRQMMSLRLLLHLVLTFIR